jgi:2-methylcitrate dehydratase PrpD
MDHEGRLLTLGRWTSGLQWAQVPAAAAQKLHASLECNIALAAASFDVAQREREALRAVHSCPGRASVWLSGKTSSAANAAALNAALTTARGQNDTLQCIGGHLGCIVWPVALSLAQECDARASDVLAAAAAGFEVPAWLAGDAAPAAMRRGFRCTSLFGVFGAAATAARLLRLDAERTAHALGLAAQTAAGLTECYAQGSGEWIWQVASAARCGVQSALLAQQGYEAARRTLEGSQGFYRAYMGRVPEARAHAWALPQLKLKAYPGCAINQSAVLALLQLKNVHGFETHQVASIELKLNPAHAAYPGIARHGPFDSPDAAIMSAPFMLQAAMEEGGLQRRSFRDRCGPDALHGRSRSIRVAADPVVPEFGCALAVTLLDGRILAAEGEAAAGVPACPTHSGAIVQLLALEWPEAMGPNSVRHLRETVEVLMLSQQDDALQQVLRFLH